MRLSIPAHLLGLRLEAAGLGFEKAALPHSSLEGACGGSFPVTGVLGPPLRQFSQS